MLEVTAQEETNLNANRLHILAVLMSLMKTMTEIN